MKLPVETFEKAVEATHGAQARLIEWVRVEEDFQGERVWEGSVGVFALSGHAEGVERAYAWESAEGRITAVLGVGPIDSPVKAVRASILAEGEC